MTTLRFRHRLWVILALAEGAVGVWYGIQAAARVLS